MSQGDDDAVDQVFTDVSLQPTWLTTDDSTDFAEADSVPMMTAAIVDAALDADNDDDDVELLAASSLTAGIH